VALGWCVTTTDHSEVPASESEVCQMKEVLCKVIAHNLCVLIASIHEIALPQSEFQAVLAG